MASRPAGEAERREATQSEASSTLRGTGAGSRDRDGNAWQYQRHSGSTQPAAEKNAIPLPTALKGLEEASGCSEWALRCVASVLESPGARSDAEIALAKINSWLGPSSDRQVLSQVIGS